MEVCESYDLPARQRVFQAASVYIPVLMRQFISRRVQEGYAIIGRDFGMLLSPPCVVDTRRRSVRC